LFAIVSLFIKDTKVTNQSLLFVPIVHFAPEPVVHYMTDCHPSMALGAGPKLLFLTKKDF